MDRRLVAWAVIAAVALAAAPASAYCRASTCGDPRSGATCDRPTGAACTDGRAPLPLAWKPGCLTYTLDAAGSADVPYGAALEATRNAFAMWTTARCGATRVGVDALDGVAAQAPAVEYRRDGANQNVIVFRDAVWPHSDVREGTGEPASTDLALTTVTFNAATGEILDADIEVNTADHHIVPLASADPSAHRGTYDLQAVITHEVGHFLGLAHSSTPGSVMQPHALMGDWSRRALSDDDRGALCAAYPARAPDTSSRRETGACARVALKTEATAATPAPTPAPAPGALSCASTPARAPSSPALPLFALALAAAWAARRARSNRKEHPR